MKILHTADWHIGKKLHKHDLAEDFDLFIDWLCELIEIREIELLLISGDVFDLANPSSEARGQYYKALLKLRKLNCRIIITGGNHDSPAMLDAPRELLRELEMHVIGGLPENSEDLIIPIEKDGKTRLVIAALPYLREADLRKAIADSTYEDRLQSIQAGIESHFQKAAEICKNSHPGVPALAMGHLFAAGVESSESERDIQVGNLAAFNARQFGAYFKYIALGHIHKPQRVSAEVPCFYSGSPLPLSFSERKDEKRVLLLDSDSGWEPESIPVPAFRSLLKISGSLEEIRQKLQAPGEQRELKSLIEIEMQEDDFDAQKLLELDRLVEDFKLPEFEIVKHRVNFKNQKKMAGDLYRDQSLEDLQPREVFAEMLDTQNYDVVTREQVESAFDELLEKIYSQEKS